MTYEINTIPLDAVRINGGTQSRVELNQTTIAEYTETVRAAIDFPPVVTFFDGTVFWLADGFHRYFAHKAAGAMEIAAEIRTGTQRDAILYSVGANASHGLRRTNEDKRRAVGTLLGDAEWSAWSQEKIAKACGVSTGFVSKMVNDASLHREEMRTTTRTVERNGKAYEQNTANIGKAKPAVVESDSTSPQPKPAADLPPVGPLDADPAPFVQPPQERVPPVAQVRTDELQALRDKVDELAEALKSTLADNEMMGRVFDADDKIKAAMDEAKRQKAIAENAERTLTAKSGEFIERARAVIQWKNRAEKAEKKLEKYEAKK